MIRIILSLLLFAAGVARAGDDLLEPEQAFRFSARALDAASVEVRYRIAPGYYMYRDKFRFSAEPASLQLGEAAMPRGKVKRDEFFGESEIYRGDLKIVLPVRRGDAAAQTLTLKAVSQGCADAGVCYVPQEVAASIKLVALDLGRERAAAETSKPEVSRPEASKPEASKPDTPKTEPPASRSLAQSLFGGGGAEFLPPDQAFSVTAQVASADTALAQFKPADGYYLYRDRTSFKLAGSGVEIARVDMPPGEDKDDPNFGRTQVFHAPFQALLKLSRAPAAGERVSLAVNYQGCSEKGLCYQPMTKSFDLVFASAGAAAVSATPTPAQTTAGIDSGADDTRIAALLKTSSFWVVLSVFFGAGVGLAFTPCVFPMVPILSGIVVGQGEHTRLRALSLSLAYVLGMALTYAAAGVAAGLSGSMLSAALQNAWVLGGFAAVMVLLALSMFGFYELQVPVALQTRLAETSNRLPGGRFAGVFAMGMLSAVIVGPCVAAPLAGALLYISQSRDVLLGGSALFAMALGMGAPLLLVGVSAGSLLPRAGKWMDAVKKCFGALLLAVAIWMISPLVSAPVQMVLWAALLIVSAVHLHALDPLPASASGMWKLWKGVGVIALLAGAAMLVGALSGGRDVLQPLSGLRSAQGGGGNAGGTTAEAGRSRFERVRSTAELDRRIRAAGGRPVMLDFYADWCVSCKEMEQFTFTDETVKARMNEVVLLQADVTANSGDDRALLARFNLFGPPGIVFFDRSGNEIKEVRVIGFQPAERFALALNDAIGR